MPDRRLVLVGALTAALLIGTAAQASAAIVIDRIQYDSPGTDNRSRASLRAEWVRLENAGSARVALGGWTLRDIAGHVYRIPNGFGLSSHTTVYIHTGSGRNGPHHLYWGMGNYVWNNTGDTARLRRATGALVDSCSYSGGATAVNC